MVIFFREFIVKIFEFGFFFSLRAINPNIGPNANTKYIYFGFMESLIIVRIWMLIIVIKKPMQFTIVRAVPFNSLTALLATRVENNGESAITTIPQNRRNPIMIIVDSIKNIKGDIIQHRHDKSKAMEAVFLVPIFIER